MQLPSLLYIYDPLCGWCYGFSPVLKKLYESLQDKLHFEVYSGAMMLGDRAGSINDVAPYIKTAYKTVEQRTGVVFGEPFLKDMLEPGTAMLNSEKPCIALTVFKSYLPGRAVEFAHVLQEALYQDGKDLTQDAIYPELVAPFGIDPLAFVEKLNNTDFKRKTYEEFKIVSEIGVTGFPTVLLLTEKQNYLLSRGYTDFEPLYQTITQIIP